MGRLDSGGRPQLVGPDAGGECHLPCRDHQGLAGILIHHFGTDDPVTGRGQPLNPGPGGHLGTVSGGGAGNRHDHPCVVLGRIEELN